MKGNNVLTLNTATIIEAVQEYLDKRLTSDARVRVTDVSPDSSYGSATYVVRVTVPKPLCRPAQENTSTPVECAQAGYFQENQA